MFQEFAALLFAARDFGHRAHLRTDTISKHLALGDFYTELTDLADKVVECYQGAEGVIDIPYLDTPTPTEDPVAEVENYLKLIQGTRDGAVGESRALNNIVDDIEGHFLRTLYKLKNLK